LHGAEHPTLAWLTVVFAIRAVCDATYGERA
jgi:hypothetical protein